MKAHVLILVAFLSLPTYAARIMDPRIPQTAPERISEHTYVIQSFPDIGFVVGNNGVLVIDTGLGPKNGAIVAEHAKRLAKGKKLYLVTTHFHPEHAGGDGGFPADTVLIRSRVQQDELSKDGGRMLGFFRRMPNINEFLPDDITFRQPNVLFDKDYTLDLGGVHARIEVVGPAHTLGDQIVWVEEDRTLFSGDLAIHDEVPQRMVEGVTTATWIAVLDRLAALNPLHVVPDHAEPGDASLIKAQREALTKQESR